MNKAKKAVFEIQKQMYEDKEFFGKSATNPFYKSKYVPLNSILTVIIPKLHEKGCLLHHESLPSGEKQIVVNSVITHIESDDEFKVPATIPIEKLNAQEGGKATTYGRRYSTAPQFGIPEYDDDGEGAMKRTNNSEKQAPAAPESIFAPYVKATGLDEETVKTRLRKAGIKTKGDLENAIYDDVIIILKETK
jgi:hypothetical protein